MPTSTRKPVTLADEARKVLEDRRAREAAAAAPVEVSVVEQAIAASMRERDHRENCPMVANRVEASIRVSTAPSRTLQDLGVRAGDRVVDAHCLDCGNVRYFTGFITLDEFIDERLAALAGEPATTGAEPDLDATL